MNNQIFSFVTDTATMCIFDLSALRHRLQDSADWWSIERDELLEMNSGNVFFVGLGSDGQYSVTLSEAEHFEPQMVCYLNCPSGRIFIGAGEEATGDGFEPEGLRGGTFLTRSPGFYAVRVAKDYSHKILLSISASANDKNSFRARLRLK